MNSEKKHVVGKKNIVGDRVNLSKFTHPMRRVKANSGPDAAFILDIDHPEIEEFIASRSGAVRVSDGFMKAVETDSTFSLRARATGKVVEIVDAKELFRELAENEISVQFDDTINVWHMLPAQGKIIASSRDGEYFSVDDSACQIATIDLLKFLSGDGEFDIEKFTAKVEKTVSVLDKSIGKGDYPTERIAANSKMFRQLGVGYENLDKLLTSVGLAHDSDEARAVAGGITSLMSAVAYRRSAEIAEKSGAYDGFGPNVAAQTFVIKKHMSASMKLTDEVVDEMKPPLNLDEILFAANREWQNAVELGAENGWRNSQVTLLALDDFSEVEPTQQVRLMAAIQPFLSGGIAWTVKASVADTEELYMQSWKLGLKSLTIEHAGEKTVRAKLPDAHQTRTYSSEVGDTKCRMTLSFYPDGNLSEVSLKIGEIDSGQAAGAFVQTNIFDAKNDGSTSGKS